MHGFGAGTSEDVNMSSCSIQSPHSSPKRFPARPELYLFALDEEHEATLLRQNIQVGLVLYEAKRLSVQRLQLSGEGHLVPENRSIATSFKDLTASLFKRLATQARVVSCVEEGNECEHL